MSDLRQDPMTGHWVAVSEVRATRPNEFRQVETRRSDIACAFCVGNESSTPLPLAIYDRDGRPTDDPTDPWLIRVIPNKYPAIYPVESSVQNGQPGPYRSVIASGNQEIIIQSPRHIASISELNELELGTSFIAFQHRVRGIQKIQDVKHAMLFQNCRSEAGASLEHVHAQLIGTPIISSHLKIRADRARKFHQRHGVSILDSVVRWEQDEASRVVMQNQSFVAFCPYASRFPFQIWIAPRGDIGDFCDCGQNELAALSSITRSSIDRIERALGYPAYNILFHFAPHVENCSNFMDWYVEIVPRLNRIAGYELGTGCWINDTDPVTAADRLRNIPETPL